jgi:hypothetical protein
LDGYEFKGHFVGHESLANMAGEYCTVITTDDALGAIAIGT